MLKDKQEEMDAQFKKEKEEVWAEQESHKKHKNRPKHTSKQPARQPHEDTACLLRWPPVESPCRMTSCDYLESPEFGWSNHKVR